MVAQFIRGLTYPGFALMMAMFSLFSPSALALSCSEASSGSLSQVIALDQAISVSTANLTPGTILWRSPSYTSTFQCRDSENYPQGENAYLYWDPASQMQGIHPSIEVGVTWRSIDIKPSSGSRTDVGRGTECRAAWGFWGWSWGWGCRSPAQSLTVSVTYSVYIKATGSAPPANGRINNTGQYAVFQVDGFYGLNSTPNSNFRAYVTGLGNIRFISCTPQVNVVANNGNTVNFGTIPARRAVAGTVEKQMPFSVVANLTNAGQDCQGQVLVASFSTTSPVSGTDIILPSTNSGFGISISTASTPGNFIPFNTSVPLGSVNGSVVQNDFIASLRWLNNSPQTGTFNASANVDVTFK